MRSPADHQPARLRAYEHLKELVVSGTAAGSFLPEAEVASTLNISRTPVREALRALEAERLLVIIPNRGAFVPEITEAQIREVMEARRLIETHCAVQALRDTRLAEQLESMLQHQRSVIGQLYQFVDEDREFHSKIVAASGNRVLAEFYKSLRDQQLRLGQWVISQSPERDLQSVTEHQAIVDAFRHGVEAEVMEAVRNHVDETLTAMLAVPHGQIGARESLGG